MSKLTVWGIAIYLAGMWLLAAADTHRNFATLAERQTKETSAILHWQASVDSLRGTQEEWVSAYRPLADVRDLVSLFRLLELQSVGIHSEIDRFGVYRIEPVEQNNIWFGLVKLCLSTGGRDGMTFTAPNYAALFSGIEALSSRRDMLVGRVDISGGDTPSAQVSNLCILLRDE